MDRDRVVRPLRSGSSSVVHRLSTLPPEPRAVRSWRLRAPDDVWYLTVDEVADPPADAADLTATRRAERESYLRMSVPDTFSGLPVPSSIWSAHHASELLDGAGAMAISGLGVATGLVTAVARVVDDPAATPFELGEVLVAHVTDPAWTPLFTLASAVVTDIGGLLSHGAIVARDLGIPCVVNTGNATSRLRSGMNVTADGTAGTVTIVPIVTNG
jgi:pyruvate,water dikinase